MTYEEFAEERRISVMSWEDVAKEAWRHYQRIAELEGALRECHSECTSRSHKYKGHTKAAIVVMIVDEALKVEP